ncbi:MAG: hypothetical protein HQ579_00700 [Candidatus Omnitrophica bacterium]|nr:hypothetical protein [Candidatus Omnitrophota bacterium]
MTKKRRKSKEQARFTRKRPKERREKEGNVMIKSLGILMGGIFIGAVGAEIIRKEYPKVVNSVYAKTREITSGAKEAFIKGYDKAMRSQQTAEQGV